MINLYISNALIVITFLSYGNILNSVLFRDKYTKKNTIFDILCGIIYLSFLALFINFFLPLNHTINNLIFILGIIFFLYSINRDDNYRNTIKLIFVISTISFLIMTLDNINRPDGGLYHLPYISIINDNKIIFGLANIHFRFGHISILQYTSAIFNNSLFLAKGITIPISIIISTLFIFFFQKFNSNHKNYFFLIFYFFITFFIIIKMSRYNDIGNDHIGHAFFFLIVIYFINSFYKKEFYYKNFFYLALFCIFAFANKVFFIFSFVFPVFFILYSKQYFFIIKKKTLLLFFLFFLFLIKNVLVSSCIIYPIKLTCFKTLSWSSVDHKSHSNPEIKTAEGKAAVKDWSNFKKKNLTYKEYNKSFKWLETWMNNHLKYILKKIIPLIVMIVVVFFILVLKAKFKNKR